MNNLHYYLLLLLTSFFIHSSAWAQTPDQTANHTFGGKSIENLNSFIQTQDGGFLLAGTSNSTVSGDKTQDNRGSFDYWIVKTDPDKNKLWDRRFGGTGNDVLYTVLETQEGGYLLIGYSSSGKGGDKTQESKGEEDYWIVKTDKDGNKLWDRTYGGSGGDIPKSAVETADGSYILAGNSYSGISGDKTSVSRGNEDYWLMKIDKNGNKVWDKTFGGNNADFLSNIITTDDGGFLISGTSYSGKGADKTAENQGSWDYWVVKIDPAGNKQWDKTYGGLQSEFPASLLQTREGNYIVAGISDSDISGDKTEPARGGWDYWVLKLDKNGNKLWDKRYGGQGNDDFGGAIETFEGNYLLGGSSDSQESGDKTQDSQGEEDYWIVKIDKDGNQLWDRTFGGNQKDILKAVIQAKYGTYHLAGYSDSEKSGSKTQASKGGFDFWLVSTAADGTFSPLLQVNFGDRYTKLPSGWDKDYGLPFGEKISIADAKTYIYGWKNAASGAPVDLTVGGPFPGNGRWRPAPADVLLATLMHMQGNDVKNFRGTAVESYWELSVDNGHYQVTVSVGDGTDYTSNDPESHSIRVEGKPAITGFKPEGNNGAATRFKQATVQVTVTDGLLTIDARGGRNTKINYAIIERFFSSPSLADQQADALQKSHSALQSIQAFPNPFTDRLLIRLLPQHQGKIMVTLQNASASSRYEWQQYAQNSVLTLDLSQLDLKTGLYFISITAENGVRQVVKVMKE